VGETVTSNSKRLGTVRSVRWGILGTGAVAEYFAQGLRVVADTEVLAVASRTLAGAQSFSQRLSVPRAYGSYEDLVEDRDVDVVYVATPPHVHRDHCVLCLEAGKPVLCEKPFTINADEAREVIALARKKQLFCMEAMWMRFIPLIQKTQEIIQAGDIGEVRMFTADFGFLNDFGEGHRFFDPDLGGGALLDLGVYPLSLAYMLLGEPSNIVSQASLTESGVDEQSTIVLKYSDKCLATIHATVGCNTPTEALIVGTKGQVRIHTPMYRPHRLSVQMFSEAGTASSSEREAASGLRSGVISYAKRSRLLRKLFFAVDGYLAPLRHGYPSTVIPFEGNGYGYEAEEVVRCLKLGRCESDIMPLDETLRIVEAMDTVRRQWVGRTPSRLV